MIGIYFTNEEAKCSTERLVAVSKTDKGNVKNYVTGFGGNIVDTYIELYIHRRYHTNLDRCKAVNQMERFISDDGLVVSIYRNLVPYKPQAPQNLMLVARFRFQPFGSDDDLWHELKDEVDELS